MRTRVPNASPRSSITLTAFSSGILCASWDKSADARQKRIGVGSNIHSRSQSLSFQLFDLWAEIRRGSCGCCSSRDNVFHVGFRRRTRPSHRYRPTDGTFAQQQRLKTTAYRAYLKGNGNGARFHQRITQLFSIRAGIQFQFGYFGGKRAALFISGAIRWLAAEEPNRFPIRKANKLSSNAGTMRMKARCCRILEIMASRAYSTRARSWR